MENSLEPTFVREVNHRPSNKKIIIYFFGIILALGFLFNFALKAPRDFPIGEIVSIGEGSGLRQVSFLLKEKNIINSRTLFEAFVILHGGEKHILWGDYLFDEKESVYAIARRISNGEKYLAPVKITIPEGYTVEEIAGAFDFKLASFNKEKFILEAKPKEGYLFPDTYFFLTTDREEEALKSLTENYEKKVSPLRPKMAELSKTEKEIIIMASIIEGEAKGDMDRELISGILWKRLDLGIPLQVDVAPETYEAKGLTKNPISNPGLEAIKAAMYPESSQYLYYLHGKDGKIHFARNFEEHKENIRKYLR